MTGNSPGVAVAFQVSGTTVTSSRLSGSPTSRLTVLPSIGTAPSGPILRRSASPSLIGRRCEGSEPLPVLGQDSIAHPLGGDGDVSEVVEQHCVHGVPVFSSWVHERQVPRGEGHELGGPIGRAPPQHAVQCRRA